MWYPSTVTAAPSTEPVTLVEAKEQCGVLAAETHFDTLLTRLIKAARAHCEKYCNARWAAQTILLKCSSFCDFARLPEGPLSSVTSIAYVDIDGADQTLPDTVYEIHKDGLEPSIGLKYGQAWPNIRPSSRITVTAVFGGVVPGDVQHAMLRFIADSFHGRENAKADDWTVVDVLLCNHRRGA
ncbi:head-tail connector protein [Mesorhizobium marinum]|uniref:Phage gp6-like head-tail connector protein n=1 Tax=Mesorhizobium marinum TaxID=3228790 RepID=A0ABV3R5I7_9HYPH